MPLLLSRGVIRRIPILMGELTVPHLGLTRVSERGGPLPRRPLHAQRQNANLVIRRVPFLTGHPAALLLMHKCGLEPIAGLACFRDPLVGAPSYSMWCGDGPFPSLVGGLSKTFQSLLTLRGIGCSALSVLPET